MDFWSIELSEILLKSQSYFFFFLIWGIVALQCCVGFCSATKWSSHVYAYIPSLPPLPPTTLTPLGHHRARSWTPCAILQLPTGHLLSGPGRLSGLMEKSEGNFWPTQYFIHGGIYMSIPNSQFIPLPHPWPVSIRPFSMSASPSLPCV